MTYKQALDLKPNTVLYLKNSNETLRVQGVEIHEDDKAVWVVGMVDGGLTKVHHRTLKFKKD